MPLRIRSDASLILGPFLPQAPLATREVTPIPPPDSPDTQRHVPPPSSPSPLGGEGRGEGSLP